MIHSLSLFLAPENAAAQATLNSPPAMEGPAVRKRGNIGSIARFMAAIAGNAIGFGALLAGCWFSLQLMQSALESLPTT
jgi:hypothetical protein